MTRLEDPLSLLFDWPVRHAVHLGLPLAILVSALAHVGGLLAFTLAPLPARKSLSPPGEVYFLLEDSSKSSGLLATIASNDPGLFSPSSVEDGSLWNLPETVYSPSFDSWQPEFLPLPVEAPPESPRASLRLPLRARPSQMSRPGLPATETAPTLIELSGDLAPMTFSQPEGTVFEAPQRQSLSPSEFLVSLGSDGKALHVFPIAGSGNEDLDRMAIRTLLGGQFHGDPGSLPAWGTAAFLWGSDVQPLLSE